MSSLNKVIMMGNLTRDPEFKQFGAGGVCKLSIASNRQYKNKTSGDMVQEVCYVDIDVWGPQAESCKEFLQKGKPVLIEGRLKFDSWKDNEGQTRSKHSIVADRVVFLYGSSQMDDESSTSNEVDKDILDKLNELKKNKLAEPKKTEKKIVSAVKSKAVSQENDLDSVEIDFQDEPPFEDDLPF